MSDEDKLAAEAELSQRSAAAAVGSDERRRQGMADALARYYRARLALRTVQRGGGGDGPVAPIDAIGGLRPVDDDATDY